MDANVTRVSDSAASADATRTRQDQQRRTAVVEIDRFDHWAGVPAAMVYPTWVDGLTEARAA